MRVRRGRSRLTGPTGRGGAGLTVLAALGLLASGCAGAATDASFSIGIPEPQYLVPSNCNETGCTEVLDALFLGLVDYDPGSGEAVLSELTESIEPNDPSEPAESAESGGTPSSGDRDTAADTGETASAGGATEANTVWTIKIKKGFTFHDGSPVTAESFITAWNFAAYGPNAQNNAYLFGPSGLRVQGYEAVHPADPDPSDDAAPEPTATTMSGLAEVSDTEFTVTLSEPFSQFRSILGYTAFYPMPAAAFTSDGSLDPEFEEAPIGDGPYRMDGQWQHNVAISTVRYEEFAGRPPRTGGVEFRVFPSLEQEWAALQENALDVSRSLPASAMETARRELGERYLTQPSSSFQVLGFPAGEEEYSDIDVRRAISRAIDRDAVAGTVFGDARRPARSFVSPVVPGFRTNTCGENCDYDVKAAQQLWDGADSRPDQITITYNEDAGHKPWVDAVCEQLTDALEVECVGVPYATFSALLDTLGAAYSASASFGPFRVGWVMDYPSIENYLAALYTSDGAANYYGYDNEEVDRLVAQGNRAESEDEAISSYQDAEDAVAEDLPVIPLWDSTVVAGHSTRVSDVRIDVFDRVDKGQVRVVG